MRKLPRPLKPRNSLNFDQVQRSSNLSNLRAALPGAKSQLMTRTVRSKTARAMLGPLLQQMLTEKIRRSTPWPAHRDQVPSLSDPTLAKPQVANRHRRSDQATLARLLTATGAKPPSFPVWPLFRLRRDCLADQMSLYRVISTRMNVARSVWLNSVTRAMLGIKETLELIGINVNRERRGRRETLARPRL